FNAAATPVQKYMCMIDGLNIVTNNAGQNTHEAGVVAMMTGVNALGQIGQQDWAAGGAPIDQLLLAQPRVLGGPTQTNKTMFGSLQLAADVRSDRDEVAPRVRSYKAPVSGSDIAQRRQPQYAETPQPHVLNL